MKIEMARKLDSLDWKIKTMFKMSRPDLPFQSVGGLLFEKENEDSNSGPIQIGESWQDVLDAVEELRTAEAVDAAVTGTSGTHLLVVNSVCGCAAGKARPGLALASR